jgi:hypothetical protein
LQENGDFHQTVKQEEIVKQLIKLEDEADSGKVSYLISPDVRHGIKGFRVSKYTEDINCMVWCGHCMFYPTLDAFYDALMKKDFDAGRKAF